MDIRQAEAIKKDYEAFLLRRANVETIKNMKAKEASSLVKKYQFEDLKDWKKMVSLRDSKKPEVEAFLDQVQEYMSSSEPQLREIEDAI